MTKPTILIVSNFYISSPYRDPLNLKREIMSMHPIAPYILAAQTPDCFNVEICDIGDVEKYYLRGDIAMVAFSTNVTPVVPQMYRASKNFHKKNVPVVWGGIHASSVPSEVLDSGIDSVVIGQGEGVWPVLLDDLVAKSLREVYFGSPSAAYNLLPEERAAINEKRLFTADEENYLGTASPDWSYLKDKPQILQVLATRGCENRCPYCSGYKVAGRTFQTKEISLVVTEIEAALAHSKRRYVIFADNNLSQNPDYAGELMDAIRGFGVRYICMASMPQLVENEGLVEKMAKAGMDTICIGFETLNQANHKGNDKDVSKFKYGADLLHKHGIAVFGSFILGFDGDTPDSVEQILGFCDKAKIDLVNTNVLTPFPGTILSQRLRKEGRIRTTDYSLYDTKHAVISTPHFTQQQLQTEFDRLRAAVYSPQRVLRRIISEHGTLLSKSVNILELLSSKTN